MPLDRYGTLLPKTGHSCPTPRKRSRPEKAPSVAKVVRDYVETHPSIRDCLADGLINLSALSRRIMDERGITQMEATLVAARRYEAKVPRHNERELRRTLANSRLDVSSQVAIVTLRNDWQMIGKLQSLLRHTLSQGHVPKLVQGSKAITLITDEATANTVEEELGKTNVLSIEDGLVEIAVRSPESIRQTPGIMAYLYSSLSTNGINVLETMSCYTDTIFVIDPGDMTRAFDILTRCIKG